MALDLSKITADLQAVVRLSTTAADAIKKFDLVNPTFNVVTEAGDIVASFTAEVDEEDGSFDPASARKQAYDRAAELDEEFPLGAPHTVESVGEIKYDERGEIVLEESSVEQLFPAGEIQAMAIRIQNDVNCANIERIIGEELKTISDEIQAQTSETVNLMRLNTLTNIPSDPLKVLSWVRKFVTQFIAPYLMTLIDVALQLSKFAGALSDLQIAVTNAQANLKACAAGAEVRILNETVGRLNVVQNKIDAETGKALVRIGQIQDDLMRVTGKSQRWIAPEELQGQIDEARVEQKKQLMEQMLRRFYDTPFGTFVNLDVTGDGQVITTENGPDVFIAAGNTLFSNTNVTSDPNLALDRAQFANSVSGELATDATFSDSIGNTILSSNNKFASSVGNNIAANSTIRETFMTNLGAFSANVSIPGANSAPGQGVNGKFEIITARGTSDQVRYQVENGLIVNIKVGLP